MCRAGGLAGAILQQHRPLYLVNGVALLAAFFSVRIMVFPFMFHAYAQSKYNTNAAPLWQVLSPPSSLLLPFSIPTEIVYMPCAVCCAIG